MKAVRCLTLFLAGSFALPSLAIAQEITIGGQVRPRFEYRNPLLITGGSSESWVSMRTRAHVTAKLDRNVTAFVQFQDVRFWGEESNTLLDFVANGFDLHQGYVDLRSNGPTEFSGRAGRQDVNFGGQRLVGTVDWVQQGRVFDGLMLGADGSGFDLDLFGSVLANDITATHDNDEYFAAAYGQWKKAGPGRLDLYGLYNSVPTDSIKTSQLTMGARWWGQAGIIRYRLEGSYQTGQRNAVDVSAFMVGARLAAVFAGGAADVTLWYDYLSGDDDTSDDKVKVFSTLFATNHKFYGLADYFLIIPVHTAGRGLQDIALKGSWKAHRDVTLRTELHSFHAAQSEGLSSGRFGEEIDLTAGYRYSGNLNISGGFAYVFAADAWGEIGRLTENAVWTFLMVDVKF